MRVRLLTNMAGPNGSALANTIVDLGDTEAKELVRRGFAVLVDRIQHTETTMLDPAIETAAKTKKPRSKNARIRSNHGDD